ncbi:hypothetical protein BDV19DRAFT_283738 [Aspergillus venezuelensis]
MRVKQKSPSVLPCPFRPPASKQTSRKRPLPAAASLNFEAQISLIRESGNDARLDRVSPNHVRRRRSVATTWIQSVLRLMEMGVSRKSLVQEASSSWWLANCPTQNSGYQRSIWQLEVARGLGRNRIFLSSSLDSDSARSVPCAWCGPGSSPFIPSSLPSASLASLADRYLLLLPNINCSSSDKDSTVEHIMHKAPHWPLDAVSLASSDPSYLGLQFIVYNATITLYHYYRS